MPESQEQNKITVTPARWNVFISRRYSTSDSDTEYFKPIVDSLTTPDEAEIATEASDCELVFTDIEGITFGLSPLATSLKHLRECDILILFIPKSLGVKVKLSEMINEARKNSASVELDVLEEAQSRFEYDPYFVDEPRSIVELEFEFARRQGKIVLGVELKTEQADDLPNDDTSSNSDDPDELTTFRHHIELYTTYGTIDWPSRGDTADSTRPDEGPNRQDEKDQAAKEAEKAARTIRKTIRGQIQKLTDPSGRIWGIVPPIDQSTRLVIGWDSLENRPKGVSPPIDARPLQTKLSPRTSIDDATQGLQGLVTLRGNVITLSDAKDGPIALLHPTTSGAGTVELQLSHRSHYPKAILSAAEECDRLSVAYIAESCTWVAKLNIASGQRLGRAEKVDDDELAGLLFLPPTKTSASAGMRLLLSKHGQMTFPEDEPPYMRDVLSILKSEQMAICSVAQHYDHWTHTVAILGTTSRSESSGLKSTLFVVTSTLGESSTPPLRYAEFRGSAGGRVFVGRSSGHESAVQPMIVVVSPSGSVNQYPVQGLPLVETT